MFASLIIPRKYFVYLLIVLFLLVFAGCRKSQSIVLKVGAVKITQEEFDQAFRASGFPDDSGHRRRFTEQYVNEKLILMEAERQGLDKDAKFLGEIQNFWEERLLKAAMLAKFEEYSQLTLATDEEVNRIFEDNKGNKSLPVDSAAAKDKIRVMIAQEKQNRLLLEWIDALRAQTKISINEQKLGLNQ